MKISETVKVIIMNLKNENLNLFKDIKFTMVSGDSLFVLSDENENKLLDAVAITAGMSRKNPLKKIVVRTLNSRKNKTYYLAISGEKAEYIINRVLLSLKNGGLIKNEIDFSIEDIEKRYGVKIKNKSRLRMTKM